MTDGTPGWFRDPNDDSLARWHDGKSWTEHTLVIADQAPGVEPEPPQIDPEPEDDEDEPFVLPRRAAASGRQLPGWFKVAGPLAVVVLLVVAFTTLSGDDDPAEDASTADTLPASLDDASSAARRAGLSDDVSDPRAGALIERICAAAERPAAVDQLGEDLGELPATSPSALRQQVGALGIGAGERCPQEMEDAPDLVDDLQDLAVDASATTTSLAPDVGAVDGGTDAGVTDAGTDAGDGTGSGTGSGGTTRTTRRGSGGGGGGTTGGSGTTAPPAPTTTLPEAQPNTRCSSEGAKARHFVNGSTLTCQKACNTNRLVWRAGACTTNPTSPTTAPGTPPPTVPPSTSPPSTSDL